MDNYQDKTIVALSTKTGGAITMIRMSGEKSHGILFELSKDNNFKPKVIRKCIIDTAVVFDKGKSIVDSCTAVIYEGEKSYTGQKSVEIFCHGSKLIAENIVSACIALGARIAEKGEFTLRAFYNGKMDLSAAEGVIDLIEAQSEAAARAAFQLEEGKLFKEIAALQDELMNVIAIIEVNIDYPEEDLDSSTIDMVLPKIEGILVVLTRLKNSYGNGKIIADGVKVVLTGEVNAGKSSLYNSLLGYDRAIVTDIAGTTRDTIEDSYNYEGVKFVLVDTAGIRDSSDKVESIGIQRAVDEIKKADVVVEVSERGEFVQSGDNVIKVKSKSDLCDDNCKDSDASDGICKEVHTSKDSCKDKYASEKNSTADIKITVKEQQSIENLRKLILSKSGYQTSDELYLTNLRQYQCVCESIEQIDNALKIINDNMMDIFACELHIVYKTLGKITGLTADGDIVNRIFDRFCVGK